MKIFSLIFALMFVSLTMISCSGDKDSDSDSTPQPEQDSGGTASGTNGEEAVSVIFDSELTASERRALETSSEKIASLGIDGSRIKGFSDIFGGNQSANVVAYLNERVNYFISLDTSWQDRLTAATPGSNHFASYGANESVFIWYTAKYNKPLDVKLMINDTPVEIDSSRIGVMQVGDIFTEVDTIAQAITLIHEARHSDCKGGALSSDIEASVEGGPIKRRECGHLHGICTEGPNAGGSCDVVAWGAYAVDYIYSLGIADACDSCSETEKQNALTNANQVVNSSIFDFTEMQNGAFGPADMSSSNEIR